MNFHRSHPLHARVRPGRWCFHVMRIRQGIALTIAVAILCLLQIPCIGFAAETTTNTTAPTGLYVSLRDKPEQLVVNLETNGVYTVLVTGLVTNSQSGLWRWDEAKRQFLLTPATNSGAFEYKLRVLRADPRQTHTLQWIPGDGIGTVAGAIDYVRFKRKGD